MITIRFNEQTLSLAKEINLHDFLAEQNINLAQGMAVAINHCFIPRLQHAASLVKDGDEISIITPMQGG